MEEVFLQEQCLDYFDDIDKHIADLTVSESVIPSNWEWLDNKLGGGFLENGKAIYVFAGETNIGKSIFLGNLATNICGQNKTVLLVSLEMPEMIYARRISSDVTKIPIGELYNRTDEILFGPRSVLVLSVVLIILPK